MKGPRGRSLGRALWGASEATGTCPFRDVAAGSYYEKAAIWAAENGLVSGYENGCFGPNDPVTRE